MPSPLELIKQGLEQNNLKLVAEGYKGLTGQEVASIVEEPPKKRGRPAKQKLVLPGDDEYDDTIEEERRQQTFEAPARGSRQQPVVQHQSRKRQSRYQELEDTDRDKNGFTKQAKREPVNTRKIQNVGNLFVDDLTIDTSDRNKWKKAYPKGHVSRGREAQKLVRVKCARCHDTFELYASEIVNNPFICNECTTSIGR